MVTIPALGLLNQTTDPILADKTISPAKRLEKIIRAHVVLVCENWPVWRFLVGGMAVWEIPTPMVRIVNRQINSYKNEFAKLVEETIEAENWKRSVEPKIVARQILGMMNSIPRWYKSNGSFSVTEVADYTVRCVFDGFFDKT